MKILIALIFLCSSICSADLTDMAIGGAVGAVTTHALTNKNCPECVCPPKVAISDSELTICYELYEGQVCIEHGFSLLGPEPCKRSIPFLEYLQTKKGYKNARIVKIEDKGRCATIYYNNGAVK